MVHSQQTGSNMKNATEVYAVVEQTVQHYISMAEKQHRRTFRMPDIEYFHSGALAGFATPTKWLVCFNVNLLKDNLQRYLVRTIPHEIAHLICYAVNGWEYTSNGKYIWHGKSFKAQMRAFGCEITRCHDMDTSEVKRKKHKTKKHAVKCTYCNWTGELGTVRKSRILRGATYTHRDNENHVIELV